MLKNVDKMYDVQEKENAFEDKSPLQVLKTKNFYLVISYCM
jgi:hypothetical protein